MGDQLQAVRVVNAGLTHIRWRLRAPSRRRLITDILVLHTRLRPVVLLDYGGKMPELQNNICSLLYFCHKESPTLRYLRVMVIEDMVYLVHIQEVTKHVLLSEDLSTRPHFVDLDVDPPAIVPCLEEHVLASQFLLLQKRILLLFHADEIVEYSPTSLVIPGMEQMIADLGGDYCTSFNWFSRSNFFELIDLSHCVRDSKVSLPTLNGWLLGYPLIYLFQKDNVAKAMLNLSTTSLQIFQLYVSRNAAHREESPEELMSFSVPSNLSKRGWNEQWAMKFMAHMRAKLNRCIMVWTQLKAEVTVCSTCQVVL